MKGNYKDKVTGEVLTVVSPIQINAVGKAVAYFKGTTGSVFTMEISEVEKVQ